VVALFVGEVLGGLAGDRWPTRAVKSVVGRPAVGWWLVNDPVGRNRLAVLGAGGALAVVLAVRETAWYVALGLWALVGVMVAVEYGWYRRDLRKARSG
jgi:hypothetical protein